MFKINAAQRLQAAAPHLLFSKVQKVLGPTYKAKKVSQTKHEIVSWHLGTARYREIEFFLIYNTATEKVGISYSGYADHVDVTGDDEVKAWSRFKKEASLWLDSGEAAPEDRQLLELLLKIKV